MANNEVQAFDDGQQYESLAHIKLSDDPVKDYFREIARTPLLSAEEETELSKRIEAGLYAVQLLLNTTEILDEEMIQELTWIADDGQAAKRHMLQANLRLVVSIAKKYSYGSSLSLLDVTQEGNLGLVRAVEKFDYAQGNKFSTYGTWWIRQSITRAMADQGRTIRLPVHVVEKLNKINRTERIMSTSLGRTPTINELSIELDMSAEAIEKIKENGRSIVSLDSPLGEEGDTTVGDLIAADGYDNTSNAVLESMFKDRLREVLDSELSEREMTIMEMRYGIDGRAKTLDEIGTVFGLTRERIRQIELKARNILRNVKEMRDLFDELNDE